jgi:hypothetical protein
MHKLSLSFTSAKDLQSRAEILPKGPQWRCQMIVFDNYPTKNPIKLYYCDSLDCLSLLLWSPLFDRHIDWVP